ncbi:hypothetical protein MASR1M12_22680 [Erysipelotrichia bacterium]
MKINNVIKLPEWYNYIEVYLTLRCNLGCSYCINESSGRPFREREELSAAQWASGLNRIDFGENPLTIGGGEPTLHKGFFELLRLLRPDIKVDLLTNLEFDVEEFIGQTTPERFNHCELPAYKAIRVSYHSEKMDPEVLMKKVIKIQDAGFSIGVFGLNHPLSTTQNMIMAELARENRVFFFVKDFLGKFNGKLFGHFKYELALDGIPKPADCRTQEILVAPNGSIFRCHRDLYLADGAIANVTDPEIEIMDKFRHCDHYGQCNPCDVKLKTNRFLQMGSCAVEIKEDRANIADGKKHDRQP